MALIGIVAIGANASSIVVAEDEDDLRRKIEKLKEEVARMQPEDLKRLGLWKEASDARND